MTWINFKEQLNADIATVIESEDAADLAHGAKLVQAPQYRLIVNNMNEQFQSAIRNLNPDRHTEDGSEAYYNQLADSATVNAAEDTFLLLIVEALKESSANKANPAELAGALPAVPSHLRLGETSERDEKRAARPGPELEPALSAGSTGSASPESDSHVQQQLAKDVERELSMRGPGRRNRKAEE
jgi:hypothetical protein